METQSLKSRLEALGLKIEQAEADLKMKKELSDAHQQSVAGMRQRYRVLSERVRAEGAAAEAQGHHVSALEKSVRRWLDSLEMEMD